MLQTRLRAGFPPHDLHGVTLDVHSLEAKRMENIGEVCFEIRNVRLEKRVFPTMLERPFGIYGRDPTVLTAKAECDFLQVRIFFWC